MGRALPARRHPSAAVGALTRRHALATLTRAWGKALKGAIRHADADGRLIVDAAEPALVAATPAQAYGLAGDLAALIDDMIIEGAPWTRLETLAPDLYDPYWRITLDFLKIAFARWPEWLAERGLIDRAKRIALLIEDEIKALEGRAAAQPSSPARPAPIAQPPASSRPSRARRKARSCCLISTSISTIEPGR